MIKTPEYTLMYSGVFITNLACYLRIVVILQQL